MISLLSPPMFQGLMNLNVLKVIDCFVLPEVVSEGKEEGVPSKIMENLFPELHTLKLVRLHEMHRFGQITNYAELSSLKRVVVEDCPKFEMM